MSFMHNLGDTQPLIIALTANAKPGSTYARMLLSKIRQIRS